MYIDLCLWNVLPSTHVPSTRNINGVGIVLSLQPTSNRHDSRLSTQIACTKKKVIMIMCKVVLPNLARIIPRHVIYQIYFLHRIIYILINWDRYKPMIPQWQGWTSMSKQLFQCEHKGTWVLTHTQITVQLSAPCLVSGCVSLEDWEIYLPHSSTFILTIYPLVN